MRGRKPKPTVLKDLHGSEEPRNPAEPIAEGDLADSPLDYPEYFTSEQRDTWEYAVRHSPPNLLKRIDAPMLELWVIAFCALRDAAREYAKSGVLQQDGRSSPAIMVIKNMGATVKSVASELGFTPVSRTRINSVVAGEPLGGTTTYGHPKDAPKQSLENYLANAPRPQTVN